MGWMKAYEAHIVGGFTVDRINEKLERGVYRERFAFSHNMVSVYEAGVLAYIHTKLGYDRYAVAVEHRLDHKDWQALLLLSDPICCF